MNLGFTQDGCRTTAYPGVCGDRVSDRDRIFTDRHLIVDRMSGLKGFQQECWVSLRSTQPTGLQFPFSNQQPELRFTRALPLACKKANLIKQTFYGFIIGRRASRKCVPTQSVGTSGDWIAGFFNHQSTIDNHQSRTNSFSLSLAWAAASLAMGTLGGEQET